MRTHLIDDDAGLTRVLRESRTVAVLGAKLGTPQMRDSRADEAGRKYRKLSTYSAQRVLRFWQAREKLAAAS